jgi:hypothetical protein
MTQHKLSRCIMVVALLLVVAAAAVGSLEASLASELQVMMDGMAAKTGFALQLGWKSADMEFTLAVRAT